MATRENYLFQNIFLSLYMFLNGIKNMSFKLEWNVLNELKPFRKCCTWKLRIKLERLLLKGKLTDKLVI